jgi:acyl dehydratase
MDKTAVGRRAEAFEMVVERSKIREMARATRSEHPAYFREVPPLVPPTFFTTMFGWMNPENDPWSLLDISPLRSVQVSQEYRFFHGPPRAGTVLTAQCSVASIERRTGRSGLDADYVDIDTDFSSHGKVLVTSRLVVAEFVGDAPPAAKRDRSAASASRPAVVETNDPDAWTIGPLTLEDFVRYAGASTHFNPIHFDPAVAEAAGLPAPTAVGMLLAGYMATHATRHHDPHLVQRIWISFRRRVWLGDVLTITATEVPCKDPDSVELALKCVSGQAIAVDGGIAFAKQPSEEPSG